jgi:hypothetical protein
MTKRPASPFGGVPSLIERRGWSLETAVHKRIIKSLEFLPSIK